MDLLQDSLETPGEEGLDSLSYSCKRDFTNSGLILLLYILKIGLTPDKKGVCIFSILLSLTLYGLKSLLFNVVIVSILLFPR